MPRPNLRGYNPDGTVSRPQKFGNKRIEMDGYTFDSIEEMKVYSDLKLLQQEGSITGLKVHPYWWFKKDGEFLRIRSKGYPGGRKVKCVLDFSFVDAKGFRVWDVKGFDTDMSRLKRAMMEMFHGIRVEVVTRKDARVESRAPTK